MCLTCALSLNKHRRLIFPCFHGFLRLIYSSWAYYITRRTAAVPLNNWRALQREDVQRILSWSINLKAHHCSWLIIRVKWLIAALRRSIDTRLVWRCDVQTETAALDHFLCCSPPIKLRSVCVNVSNDRENGCPPLSSPSCLLEATRSCCSRKKNTATMFSSGESAAGNSPQDLVLNYFFKVSHGSFSCMCANKPGKSQKDLVGLLYDK